MAEGNTYSRIITWLGISIKVKDWLERWSLKDQKPYSTNIAVTIKPSEMDGNHREPFKMYTSGYNTYKAFKRDLDYYTGIGDEIVNDPVGPINNPSGPPLCIIKGPNGSFENVSINASLTPSFVTVNSAEDVINKTLAMGTIIYAKDTGNYYRSIGAYTPPAPTTTTTPTTGGGGGTAGGNNGSNNSGSSTPTTSTPTVQSSAPVEEGSHGDSYAGNWDCYVVITHGNSNGYNYHSTYYLPVIPQEVSESTSASFNPISLFGRSVSYQVYQGSSRSLSFSLELHEELVKNDYQYVHRLVAAFQSACYPKYISNSVLPPEVLINVGKQFRIRGILTDCGANWTTPIINNQYVHCTLSLSVLETAGPFDADYIKNNLSIRY